MNLPAKMRAVEVSKPGGPEALVPAERPLPVPRAHEILIKVAAAGVNRPDVLQRMGLYPVPPGASPLPGLEIAGEVAQIGGEVNKWKVGDKVCALANGGGYAEYCAVRQAQALPIPRNLGIGEAASLPETFFPVCGNVSDRGRLSSGESWLVAAGTSRIAGTPIA